MFQWFNSPSTFIYPIIPATAATLLKNDGFRVDFYDGIALRQNYEDFVEYFKKTKPDIVAMETKTPIVKQHWKIINELKEISPETFFVLMGDHVSALPEESMQNSKVDFVLTGGDFDVLLLGVARHIRNKKPLPPGVWYRDIGIKTTGKFQPLSNLDELPLIDRELTHWELYGEAYLFRPVAYIMSGRDCPMKCSFCSWSWNLFPGMRYRSVENVLDEIEMIVKKYKIREIFDDTGTLTINRKWIEDFCNGLIERGLNKKIYFSTNARFDNLTDISLCRLMKKANFRLLKVGLESGNDETLKKINKGLTTKTIEEGYKTAKDAGLEIMITIMVGYPWETKEDAEKTINFAKGLMTYRTKIGDSLQASIVTPYPGTLLHKQALENKWFAINPTDYEKYDMIKSVFKTQMEPEEIRKLCGSVWKIFLNPVYVTKSLTSIRSKDEFKLLFRGVKSVVGHVKDFW